MCYRPAGLHFTKGKGLFQRGTHNQEEILMAAGGVITESQGRHNTCGNLIISRKTSFPMSVKSCSHQFVFQQHCNTNTNEALECVTSSNVKPTAALVVKSEVHFYFLQWLSSLHLQASLLKLCKQFLRLVLQCQSETRLEENCSM